MIKLLHRRGWSWYAAKTPTWLQWFYSKLLWRVATNNRVVYLTFDDGPIPEVTEFVLDTLQEYNVKAHFFCIGKNVAEHPDIYLRVQNEGHVIANHTFNHANGWKMPKDDYVKEVTSTSKLIESKFFRPPYGRITKAQIKELQKQGYKIIMWDVLSGDFDTSITPEKCYTKVVNNVEHGSIIVFHDSIKAFPNMKIALPKTLEWLKANGYSCALLS